MATQSPVFKPQPAAGRGQSGRRGLVWLMCLSALLMVTACNDESNIGTLVNTARATAAAQEFPFVPVTDVFENWRLVGVRSDEMRPNATYVAWKPRDRAAKGSVEQWAQRHETEELARKSYFEETRHMIAYPQVWVVPDWHRPSRRIGASILRCEQGQFTIIVNGVKIESEAKRGRWCVYVAARGRWVTILDIIFGDPITYEQVEELVRAAEDRLLQLDVEESSVVRRQ